MNIDGSSSVMVTGAKGMVGQALVLWLKKLGCGEILAPSHRELELTDRRAVAEFFNEYQPDAVFHAAAKVGGIMAHSKLGGDFISANLAIQQNVIDMALLYGTKNLVFFGSACAYPKHAICPIQESALLCGELEETNRAYAIAKIAGIEMCKAYRKQHNVNFVSLMPTNLYGIGDNYHPNHSHVLPGMIRKIHEAKEENKVMCTLWGSGQVTREFLWAGDLARAAVLRILEPAVPDLMNVGSGDEIRLCHLAAVVCDVIGFKGVIYWDNTKPDGTPRRVLDSSLIRQYGWQPTTTLEEGVKLAYEDFLARK